MKVETVKQDGKEFDIYSYNVPMMHKDFHDAEDNNRVMMRFNADGNDYWDYTMEWVKKEDVEVAKVYFDSMNVW